MGLENHQIFFGEHANTDNRHLHIVVNRVNPETEKVTRTNRGFYLEAAHKVIAKIEAVQGWQKEKKIAI